MAVDYMLENLPDEIKLKICPKFVVQGHEASTGLCALTALRLTCKAFAFLAAEKIF